MVPKKHRKDPFTYYITWVLLRVIHTWLVSQIKAATLSSGHLFEHYHEKNAELSALHNRVNRATCSISVCARAVMAPHKLQLASVTIVRQNAFRVNNVPSGRGT